MDSSGNGYNPLRWDCEKQGCFNLKRRPKIELFSELFPGKISFGDVDGLVEINGRGLMLEWKTFAGKIPMGQKITYEKLSRDGLITVLCIVGDAETMEIRNHCIFFKGKRLPVNGYKDSNLEAIKQIIKRWVAHAKNQKE